MMNSSVSLKLLIDAKRGVVLFAETSENLADFIHDVLSQPDNVVSLLRQQVTAAGSSANLCNSIQDVNAKSTYKDYCCPNFCDYQYTDDPLVVCPLCSCCMDQKLEYVAPPAAGNAQAAVYIITDDLEITPMSAISIVTLFKRLRVKDDDVFEEKFVDFGVDEAIKLVNASRQSKKVLTDVFLKSETSKREIDDYLVL